MLSGAGSWKSSLRLIVAGDGRTRTARRQVAGNMELVRRWLAGTGRYKLCGGLNNPTQRPEPAAKIGGAKYRNDDDVNTGRGSDSSSSCHDELTAARERLMQINFLALARPASKIILIVAKRAHPGQAPHSTTTSSFLGEEIQDAHRRAAALMSLTPARGKERRWRRYTERRI